LMEMCWKKDPDQRPVSFLSFLSFLTQQFQKCLMWIEIELLDNIDFCW
jgi:hypothetical protein